MSSSTLYGRTIYTNGVGVTLSVHLHRLSQGLKSRTGRSQIPRFSFVVNEVTISPVRFWVFGGHRVFLKMKKVRLKNSVLWMSLAGNILLLALVVYIGCIKSNYITNKLERIGIMKIDPKKRGDYWCIQGWTNTLEKLHLDVDVVFFGNSITRGSSFEESFPDVSICNLGYPGDTTDGMLLRVNQIKAVNPEKVFVMAGINGLHIQSEDVFTEKYRILVDSIKQVVPTAEIYLQSILPVNTSMKAGKSFNKEKIATCNKIVKQIAEQKGCVYVDLYSLYAVDGIMPEELTKDGVHLYPEAYDRWAKEIQKYIEQGSTMTAM